MGTVARLYLPSVEPHSFVGRRLSVLVWRTAREHSSLLAKNHRPQTLAACAERPRGPSARPVGEIRGECSATPRGRSSITSMNSILRRHRAADPPTRFSRARRAADCSARSAQPRIGRGGASKGCGHFLGGDSSRQKAQGSRAREHCVSELFCVRDDLALAEAPRMRSAPQLSEALPPRAPHRSARTRREMHRPQRRLDDKGLP